MPVTLDRSAARRIYLLGDTFPLKDRIKSIGGHWDAERWAWWVSSTKAKEAEAIISAAPAPQTNNTPTAEDPDQIRLVGKGKYKDRTYYIRWMGRTTKGTDAARLISTDGKLTFWVDLSLVEVLKTYSPREYRGRTEYTTLGSIQRFVARAKKDEAELGYSPSSYPRSGCSCGSREGIIQPTDCFTCRHDAE